MKKIICFLSLAWLCSSVSAQTIAGAEYFIDTDPGRGNGIAINVPAPATDVSLQFTVPTASLTRGFHLLGVRSRDAGSRWGLLEARTFYVMDLPADASAITGAEYFIDQDPGVGAGTPISFAAGNTPTIGTTINTTGLTNGFHLLAIRTRNADGHWSLFESRGFYVLATPVDASAIVAAEYFVDVDPGVGNAIPLAVGSSGNTVNFTVSLPTSALAPGLHLLGIRTRNATGNWSHFESRMFFICSLSADMAAITAAEYFIDSDPGVGNGSPLTVTTPGTTVNQNFVVNVPPGIPAGTHILAVRTRDAGGIWGHFELSNFTVSGALPLDWLSFTGQKNSSGVELQWTTANEVNTSHFEIERSANGVDFRPIGRTAAGGQGDHSYVFQDTNPLSGVNFYRLRQVDQGGAFRYSSIVRILHERLENNLRVFPLPASARVQLAYSGNANHLLIEVYDMRGRHLLTERRAAAGILELNIQSWSAGHYQVVVSDGQQRFAGRIVKQ